MTLRGRRRFRIALAMIVCLLFQHVAMAAYVCTMTGMPAESVAMAAGCADMGMERTTQLPAFCAKHCAPDQSIAADHTVLSVPPLALPPVAFDLVFVQPPSHVTFAADVPTDRSDPPPRLRYCSLLI